MNRKITETPYSKISVIDLKTVRRYTTSFVIICHTRDTESLKKTLHYIIDKKLNTYSNSGLFISGYVKVKEHLNLKMKGGENKHG